MDYLPIFVDVKNRPVLLVGGGQVAARKITMLLKAQATIQVIAPELHPSIQTLVDNGQVQWRAKQFQDDDINNVYLTIAATDDTTMNQRVFAAAESRQRLVNVVDNQALCHYIFPSIIDRSPVQIAISSGGASPVLIRLLREKLEALLPQHLGIMAAISARWRNVVKEKISNLSQRRQFWEKLLTHKTFQHFTEQQQIVQAEAFLQKSLTEDTPPVGEVTLVGAGPGDAGLLTLKGLQKIQQADVVLYDALVSESVLDLVRRDADKIFVGKRAGNHHVIQEETNRLLVQYAKQGKRVVRLKGGDPFVFGRGGEELETLKQADIPFSVVPGITAALGATAYAGIPLTHRDYAQTAMFITGHLKPDSNDLSWEALAQGNQTLVVYMGTIKAKELSLQLQRYGRDSHTPVAIISHGTLLHQRVQTGTLAELASLAEHAESPSLIVIGEVVQLQSTLAWFGSTDSHYSNHLTGLSLS